MDFIKICIVIVIIFYASAFDASASDECNSNLILSVSEVQRAINMFSGQLPPSICVDEDSSGSVSISEVQKTIYRVLGLTVAGSPLIPVKLGPVTIGTKTSSTAVVSWPTTAGATTYKIFRDGNAIPLTTVLHPIATITDSGLTTTGSYSYTVQACGVGGCGPVSDPAVVSMRYLKISHTGTPLGDDAVQGTTAATWACTKDQFTGLMWEVKTDANTASVYTNYDSTAGNQKLISTMPYATANVTLPEINASTNSIGFENSTNASALCGASDWVIPSVAQLKTLQTCVASATRLYVTDCTAVSPLFFPNTAAGDYISSTPQSYSSKYYSGTESASFGSTFDSGFVPADWNSRSLFKYLRLVR